MHIILWGSGRFPFVDLNLRILGISHSILELGTLKCSFDVVKFNC